MEPAELTALVAAVLAGDPQAAVAVRALGERLLALAADLEAAADPYVDDGGMADRVKMQVVGPDGRVKQAVDVRG